MNRVEWNRRLENAKVSAQSREEGEVTFLQVTTTPLTSLFIITGTKIQPSISQTRNIHLEFVT